MKVVITGASGMVGKGVLYECIDDSKIEKIISIGRSKVDVNHDKLTEINHTDFLDFQAIENQLIGIDACFFCLGISAAGMKEDAYKKITYDYTLSLAKSILKFNPDSTFIYVSGQGTDSTEEGRTMWARVKGKTENDLLNLDFKQSFMFRPGAIIPLRGIESRTKSYQFVYDYFTWLIKIIKLLFPKSIVNTTQIGLAMINIASNTYQKQIINPKDIIILSEHNK